MDSKFGTNSLRTRLKSFADDLLRENHRYHRYKTTIILLTLWSNSTFIYDIIYQSDFRSALIGQTFEEGVDSLSDIDFMKAKIHIVASMASMASRTTLPSLNKLIANHMDKSLILNLHYINRNRDINGQKIVSKDFVKRRNDISIFADFMKMAQNRTNRVEERIALMSKNDYIDVATIYSKLHPEGNSNDLALCRSIEYSGLHLTQPPL